jgi:hypothetical protein
MSTPAATRPASRPTRTCSPRCACPYRSAPCPRGAAEHRPAAQPSLTTKSGLMVGSPTRPRMPSVPKYLRFSLFPPEICAGRAAHPRLLSVATADQPQRIDGRGDVVHAQDVRAAAAASTAAARLARAAHRRAATGDGAEHRLARQPDKHRRAQSARTVDPAAPKAQDYAPRSCQSQSPDRSAAAPEPARHSSRSVLQKRLTSSTTSSYSGIALHVRGCPCMCIKQTGRPVLRPHLSAPGARSARTSLIMPAPASAAARMTSGLEVSTEIGCGSAGRSPR